MTQTIRVAGECDILVIVPSLLGFEPADSLVVILLAGGRVAVTGRLDLAQARERGSEQALLAPLRRTHADSAILIAYADELDTGTADLLQRWADELPERAETLGLDLDVLAALQVATAESRWRSIWGDPAGEPLDDLRTSAAGCAAIYAGCAPAASREAAAALLEPGSQLAPSGFEVAAEAALLGVQDLGLSEAGSVLDGYLDQIDRDEALPDEVLGAVAALSCLDAGLRAAMQRISTDTAERWQTFWSQVARLSPGAIAYGPLVLVGATAIATGEGMAVNVAGDHAERLRPGHWGVALLRRANDAAVPPSEWPAIREAVSLLEPSA
ncbi:MAG: DUF4192 domain-containing protein [Propionibacterium sp.]|nr:DUF4192 domain-containing protein [Propionibacterium sp.]